ncbi:MAG: hypothetical protein PHN75_10905, partial [Syntrophales bacterium]|nr:hypothetical protein [Syntrophales bacterium]
LEEADMETSASITVSALTKGKPPTPAGLQAKGGLVKKVELTWTAGKGEDIEGYNVYWSKDRKGQYQQIKRLNGRTIDHYLDESRSDAKIDDGIEYYYRITSFNKVDVESEPAAIVSAITKPKPVKPSGLKSEGIKVKSALLRWTPNPEKDISIYQIFRSDSKGDQFSVVGKATGQTEYLDRDLKDGQICQYKIRAEDKDELLSDFSDIVKAQTKAKPQPPQGLSGSHKSSGVEIRWKPNTEQDIVSYNVYEKGFFNPTKKGSGIKEPSYLDNIPLKTGKERVYLVTAVDKDDLESEFSQELTIVGQ